MKADLVKRFVAVFIDALLAGIVTLIPFIGGFIGAAYLLLRDGFDFDFMKGRSLGKVAMNLKPVLVDGERDCDITSSVKRNWTLAISYVFASIPVVNVLFGVIGAVLWIIEGVLVISDADGRRIGDKVAGTKVTEIKK